MEGCWLLGAATLSLIATFQDYIATPMLQRGFFFNEFDYIYGCGDSITVNRYISIAKPSKKIELFPVRVTNKAFS